MADEEILNTFDPAIPEDLLPQPEVSWEYLFQPDQWYITPEVISENFLPLVLSFAAVIIAGLIFLFARNKGIESKWYKDLQKGKNSLLNDNNAVKIWLVLYIPLAIASWLVYIHGGQTWNRALTVYSLHLIVNVLFAVSYWWVQDLSLGLLNLITLIGVAMFTSSQFNSVLKFASYINTPYMIWLLIYTVYFGYIWYLNEGKQLLEEAKLARGGSNNNKTVKKKKAGIPSDVKKKLQLQVQEQKNVKVE
ncbi:hypothetical protein ABK040_013033 [Willaertia magna]